MCSYSFRATVNIICDRQLALTTACLMCWRQRRLAEQAMLLCKARCIHDANLPSATRPPCLQERTTPLPTVDIALPQPAAAASGEGRSGKRTLGQQQSGELVAAVATSVIQVSARSRPEVQIVM